MITSAVLFERFAGRDDEVDHLIATRLRCLREMKGATISISGEAGVGKSRLITEFAGFAGRERGAFVRVRCEEMPVAYSPLIDALHALGKLRELRTTDTIAKAVDAMTTAGTTADSDPTMVKHHIFERAVAAFAEAAKRTGQLTLVVDDVHWSDLSSLELLRRLAILAQTVPLLLVIAYRPEHLSRSIRARSRSSISNANVPTASRSDPFRSPRSRRCCASPSRRPAKRCCGASTICRKASRTLRKSSRGASSSAARKPARKSL